MAIFWDAAPRSLADIDQSFWGSYCYNHGKLLWNVGQYVPEYKVQYSRRHDVIQGNLLEFVWKDRGKPRKPPVRTAGIRAGPGSPEYESRVLTNHLNRGLKVFQDRSILSI